MKKRYPKPFDELSETIPVSENDLVDTLFKGLPVPKVVSVYGNNIGHKMITKFSLAAFGMKLLQDSNKDLVPYLVSVPARKTFGGVHMTAMLFDNKNKEIIYQDSVWSDMNQEVIDFLQQMFPTYSVHVIKEQRQGLNNDNSCLAMAAYNLRDMLYAKTGQEHKLVKFNSVQARQDLFNQVKDIVEEDRPKVKFAKAVIKTKSADPNIEKLQKETFEYKMIDLPDYKEQIGWAVENAKSSYQMFFSNINQNFIS